MKKTLLIHLFILLCLYGNAQNTDKAETKFPHYTFANGTTISTKYDSTSKVFTIGVENNPSEVEVTIIKDGIPVDGEKTYFENEEFSINLTTYGDGDLKVLVRNEDEAVEVKKVDVESEE